MSVNYNELMNLIKQHNLTDADVVNANVYSTGSDKPKRAIKRVLSYFKKYQNQSYNIDYYCDYMTVSFDLGNCDEVYIEFKVK